MRIFTQKEKLEHYTEVAKGTKNPKAESKHSTAEQIAYAKGQRDARNEARKLYAIKKKNEENGKTKKGVKK